MFLAADRADMLQYDSAGNASLSNFVNPGMFLYSANHELAALWDHLVNAHEDYFTKREYLHIVANQEEYSLPRDFYKSRKVFPILTEGAPPERGAALKRFKLADLGTSDVEILIIGTEVRQLRYNIKGNRIWFHPTPTTAADVELWYIPQYDPLENDDDLLHFSFPNGWEDYVVEGVAARALEKEESDSSFCRARQQEILQRILNTVQDRDEGEPFEIIDTQGYEADWEDAW
jgi:hypothetical protein